jgi:integrase/recombinase XerD
MITLKRFLRENGYSDKRYNAYKKCLDVFLGCYNIESRITKNNIVEFIENNPTYKNEIGVIEKYLRYTLHLDESKSIRKVDGQYLDLEELVKQYLNNLLIKGYRPRSIKLYHYQLKIFTAFLDKKGIFGLSNRVTKNVINAFKTYLYKHEWAINFSASSQKHILCRVRHFLDFLVREKIILNNPAKLVTMPRQERRISNNYLNPKEVESFLNAIDISSAYGFMDRAIFEVTYSTGMRLNEIIHLKIKHLRLDDNMLIVKDG